jgi:hypothetical protein
MRQPIAVVAVFAAVLAGAVACGGQTIKQQPEPVTVTETVEGSAGTTTAEVETTTEATDSDVAGIGDTITVHGYEDGEELTVTVKRLIDPAKSEQYFGPRRGHKFVAVDLVLRNTGSAAYNDSPGNGAELIDNRDHGYNESLYETPSCHSIGSSVKIAPGSKRAGCILFEVSKKGTPALFQFTMDSGFADETGEWKLR